MEDKYFNMLQGRTYDLKINNEQNNSYLKLVRELVNAVSGLQGTFYNIENISDILNTKINKGAVLTHEDFSMLRDEITRFDCLKQNAESLQNQLPEDYSSNIFISAVCKLKSCMADSKNFESNFQELKAKSLGNLISCSVGGEVRENVIVEGISLDGGSDFIDEGIPSSYQNLPFNEIEFTSTADFGDDIIVTDRSLENLAAFSAYEKDKVEKPESLTSGVGSKNLRSAIKKVVNLKDELYKKEKIVWDKFFAEANTEQNGVAINSFKSENEQGSLAAQQFLNNQRQK